MKNIDLRKYAYERKVCLWQISEQLGYSHESAFSRIMRHELTAEKKSEIREIIDAIAAGQ